VGLAEKPLANVLTRGDCLPYRLLVLLFLQTGRGRRNAWRSAERSDETTRTVALWTCCVVVVQRIHAAGFEERGMAFAADACLPASML